MPTKRELEKVGYEDAPDIEKKSKDLTFFTKGLLTWTKCKKGSSVMV